MTIGKPVIEDGYIRVRQKNPEDFQKDTFRTINLGKDQKAIIGKLKGETSTTIQSRLYPKDKYRIVGRRVVPIRSHIRGRSIVRSHIRRLR